MKGLRGIPKILKIYEVNGYNVCCLFNNGEARTIDFKELFANVFRIDEKHVGFELLQSEKAFRKVKVMGYSLGWEEIGIHSKNFEGEEVFYPFVLDPLVLYENSKIDEERNYLVGKMLKNARKAAGLTQEELASRSGTSKHYVSRIENNKSDIEVLTLKKIVEAGLGKKLLIDIV